MTTTPSTTAAAAISDIASLSAQLASLLTEIPTWDTEQRRSGMRQVDAGVRALLAVKSAIIRAEQAAGTWKQRGDSSIGAWIGRTTGVGTYSGNRQHRWATTLGRLPSFEAALAVGSITMDHIAALSRVLDQGNSEARYAAAASPAGTRLLDLAKGQNAARFAKAAACFAQAADPAGADDAHRQVRERRFLRCHEWQGGLAGEFFLDPIAGAIVREALDAATPRPGKDDTRSADQRRADALTEIASHALDAGRLKAGANVRPHALVIVNSDSTGVEDTESEVPTLADGTPIPPSALGSILCDATWTRVVMGSDSVVLDVGRSRRLFERELRLAIVARDRTCRWIGCDRPAAWGQIHHVITWQEGGNTCVDNGLLVCAFHHHRIHDDRLIVQVGPDGVTITTQNGAVMSYTPHPARARPRRGRRRRPPTTTGGQARAPASRPAIELDLTAEARPERVMTTT